MSIFLRILLLPLSIIYSIIISIRNLFYDKNIFISSEVSKPVISIGNISTGGTGKSPFTILLATLFKRRNLRPAIISRGYKRISKDIEIVFDGKKLTGDTEKCGDEPMMIARRLYEDYTDFYVVTSKDRVNASEFVIKNFHPDIIILDDAFQHRKIKRNLDIVLIDAEDFIKNKFKNKFTIPAGNLREKFDNIACADIIIQNNKFSDIGKIEKLQEFNNEILILNYGVKGFYNDYNNPVDITGKEVCIFAGIAQPESFFKKIQEYNCKIIDSISFPDHTNYDKTNVLRITRNADRNTYFITTEKDFVKIREYDNFAKNFNVLFMKIELILDNEEKFFSLVNKYITES